MINDIRTRFKKFGGDFIPDILVYLKNQIDLNPNLTISVGCDSIQKRRKTTFAITIMLYDKEVKNGAHVVFFRETLDKVRNNIERLDKEAFYAHFVAEFLDKELSSFYTRKDLSDSQRKFYKYHLDRCDGNLGHIEDHNLDNFIKNISLSEYEKEFDWKLVDIHLDYNPFEGSVDSRGYSRNKSNLSYRTHVPWIRSSGYRVWVKPFSPAATGAADLLLQD
jgi:predicted RNase H-related nuclease YkuK (DUF458 family)